MELYSINKVSLFVFVGKLWYPLSCAVLPMQFVASCHCFRFVCTGPQQTIPNTAMSHPNWQCIGEGESEDKSNYVPRLQAPKSIVCHFLRQVIFAIFQLRSECVNTTAPAWAFMGQKFVAKTIFLIPIKYLWGGELKETLPVPW